MNQEFYVYYSTLSTVELLQIEANRQNYQPEAVEAALLVLQSRTVTNEDHQALADMAAAENEQAQRKKEKREALKTLAIKVADTTRPGPEKTGRQLIILFCIGLAICYLLSTPRTIRYTYYAFTHGAFTDPYMYTLLLGPIITSFQIYLLYKQNKWGWLITAFLYTVSLLVSTIGLLRFSRVEIPGFLGYLRPSLYSELWPIVLYGGVLYFINTRRFMELYPVTNKLQFKTIALSCVIGLLISFIL